MLVIVGWIVVSACVVIGYTAHHGNLAVLWQPTEMIIIIGAGIGGLIVQATSSQLKEIGKQVKSAMTKKEPTKDEIMEVLLLVFELTKTAKGNLLGLEAHVENPSGSDIFQRYPSVLKNHHAINFICDTLKVQISSPVSPYDLEDLMDADIAAAHSEEACGPANISKVGDAMPALGIVAAVLGIVITMGKLTQGKEIIGHSVAAALVGTFIGVLISYGFLGPLAMKMEANNAIDGKVLDIVKAGLLAFAKDCSPKVCVEFARRTVPNFIRPTFDEVDQGTSNIKK